MKISSTYNSGLLSITIDGRIDGSEAPKFQQELSNIINSNDDPEEIVIDAAKLAFISSLGLRVLLALKKQYDKISIINCSADVFNVFKMTGFTHILDVRKALPQVSVEGLSNVSGMPDVYQLTDETMIKVFPKGTTKEDVDREVELAKEIFILGIPTAMAFDIVMVDDRYGLIYESITPSEIDAKTLGDLIRALHEHIIEPDGKIPSSIDREKNRIHSLEPYLGEEAVAKLMQMLSAVPDGSSILHGNISTNKVMYNNGEPIMFDMSEVGYGNHVIDLARFYSSLPEDKKGEFFDEFLRSYYDMESDETIARNKQNIVILSMIRDFTRLTFGGEPTEAEVEDAKKAFEEKISSRWDEILSRLRFKMDFNEEIRKLERKRFYIDSEVNIDWVANTLGTNRHYVSDYFNKVLHTTFNDYINTLRLDYAVQLLRAKKIPGSQIAYAVGFNNDHTFRRLFKQRYGCTPSQFEKD